MWNQDFVKEKDPVNPKTDLAISRLEAERLILNKMTAREKNAYILRPRFIFGKGDKTLNAIVDIVKKGLFLASPQNKYSFIVADDYAKIIMQLADKVFSNKDKPVRKILNIGYNNFIDLEKLVDCICGVYSITDSIRYQPLPSFVLEMLFQLPSKKLKSMIDFIALLGWSHYGDVTELESEIGNTVSGRDCLRVFSQLLGEMKEK